jgi:hypothetical protein
MGLCPSHAMTQEYLFEVDWTKSGVYVDESARVMSITVQRGRSRGWSSRGKEPIRTGEAWIVLDNDDRRYDPYNTGSPLYGYLKPGRMMHLYAGESGVEYPVYTGFIRDIRPIGNSFSGDVTIYCVDGLDYLNRQFCQSVGSPTNYPVSDALNDLLQQSEWPFVSSTLYFPAQFPMTIGETGIDNNGDTIDTFTTEPSEYILTAMNEIAAAFVGDIFVSKSGSLRYVTRNSTRPTVMTITEAGEIIEDDNFAQTMPWDEIYNDIRCTPTVGSEQSYLDTTSKDDYGRSVISITSNDYIQSNTHALNVVNFLKLFLPQIRRNIDIVIKDNLDYQFKPELLDRIQVTVPSIGLDALYNVEQIRHYAVPGKLSETRYRLEVDAYWLAGLEYFPAQFPMTLGW